jgi:two-component system sensor histidine kinase UhpB
MIDDAIPAVQQIVHKLHPVILDELGLIPAVEWYTQEFSQRTGIECNVEIPQEDCELNKAGQIALFRIIQESLTNVARHSNATSVSVSLTQDEHAIELIIIDNGKGITLSQINDHRSHGILGMKERIIPFNGTFDIRNSMKSGTKISVRIPIIDGLMKDEEG